MIKIDTDSKFKMVAATVSKSVNRPLLRHLWTDLDQIWYRHCE